MIYKKENINNLRIFSETFVKNNINKGELIIKNKKFHLKDIISTNNINEDIIKIKMILNRYTCNFNCMFRDCISLKYFSQSLICNDIDTFISIDNNSKNEYDGEINKIEDDSSSSNMSEISEISKTDDNSSESSRSKLLSTYKIGKYFFIKNHIVIKEIFYNCKSLLSLPDILNWNTENAIEMSKMFYNCESLTSIPDISEWKTDNVIDIQYMFYNCKSLSSLPDISKWNIMNVRLINSNLIIVNL